MKKLPLLIATQNEGKLREYRRLLAGLPLRPVSPRQLHLRFSVEELGNSFKENAILKAKAYGCASGLWTLADDSGLEVDALGGEPGIHSSRFGGPEATNEDNIRLLMSKMEGITWERRTARFRCVIALAEGCRRVFHREGTCEGIINFEPRGFYGFGYDPVFYLPNLGKTIAELLPALKNSLSHRGRATAALRPLLLAISRGVT